MAFKRYLVLIGLLLFTFILSQINLKVLVGILAHSNWAYVFLALLVVLLVLFLKAWKWHVLLQLYSKEISLMDCFQFWCASFFVSILTPGRVGDFCRAFYVRDRIPLPSGIAIVLVDRLIDILLLLVWALISIFLFSLLFGKTIISLSFIGLILVGFLFALWFFSNPKNVKRLLSPLFNYFIPDKFKNLLKVNFTAFYESIYFFGSNKKTIAYALLITLICWLGAVLSGYFVVLALGLPLPLIFIFVIMPLMSLVDLIPISISGLGTRDALIIFLFSFYALPPESSVAFSFSYLIIGYLFPATLGFLYFARSPIHLRMLAQN